MIIIWKIRNIIYHSVVLQVMLNLRNLNYIANDCERKLIDLERWLSTCEYYKGIMFLMYPANGMSKLWGIEQWYSVFAKETADTDFPAGGLEYWGLKKEEDTGAFFWFLAKAMEASLSGFLLPRIYYVTQCFRAH